MTPVSKSFLVGSGSVGLYPKRSSISRSGPTKHKKRVTWNLPVPHAKSHKRAMAVIPSMLSTNPVAVRALPILRQSNHPEAKQMPVLEGAQASLVGGGPTGESKENISQVRSAICKSLKPQQFGFLNRVYFFLQRAGGVNDKAIYNSRGKSSPDGGPVGRLHSVSKSLRNAIFRFFRHGADVAGIVDSGSTSGIDAKNKEAHTPLAGTVGNTGPMTLREGEIFSAANRQVEKMTATGDMKRDYAFLQGALKFGVHASKVKHGLSAQLGMSKGPIGVSKLKRQRPFIVEKALHNVTTEFERDIKSHHPMVRGQICAIIFQSPRT